MLVGLAVGVALVLALSATAISGWVLGVVVALALALEVLAAIPPSSVKRYRQERNLARAFWRALTTR
jgi:hypothetical protein